MNARLNKYILDSKGRPVVEPDLFKWARWIETAKRHVGDDFFGEVRVSTIFLGLDHNYAMEGPPVLWETLIFGGKLDQHLWRCSGTWEQAEAMHAQAVAQVKAVETGVLAMTGIPKVTLLT